MTMSYTHERRPLHRLLPVMVLTLIALPALAQRGDDADRASKNGRTAGVIDGVEITIEYGRPNAKGRTLWGGLVPFGKVWRTGANEATTFELGAAATVEGQSLAAGRYGLFTIPGESEWTVIFNSVPSQWGAFNYNASKDVLRVTVQPASGDHVEAMDFVIEGDKVVLRWGELRVPFTVAARD